MSHSVTGFFLDRTHDLCDKLRQMFCASRKPISWSAFSQNSWTSNKTACYTNLHLLFIKITRVIFCEVDMRHRQPIVLLAVLVLFASLSANAQVTTATLVGLV